MKLKVTNKMSSREVARRKKKVRVRNKLQGTPERPRFSVFRSLKSLYAQAVDDTTGQTLFSVSTLGGNSAEKTAKKGASFKNKEAAQILGQRFAKIAMDKNLKKFVFDRNGYLYHGKVKEIAEAARKAGLEF